MFVETCIIFAAVISFCVLFAAPRNEWFFCGLGGSVSWMAYQFLKSKNVHFAFAVLGATVVLALLAKLFAILRRHPATIYLLPGIFPLVPGAGIYYTSYFLIMGDWERFSQMGVETFETAAAIALGIILVSALPDRKKS